MKSESWITIKAVLQEVLNIAPSKRAEFLENAGLSLEIKEEVQSLIEFEEESEKFISVSANSLTGELIFEAEVI